MGQVIFRCVLIVAVLILIFGVGTRVFSYALSDAYNILIGNGWTIQDALGFLGTSIAGTLAMNPSVAPAVAAAALAGYIGVKGAQLYDIYREWRNLRTGRAILNPVEFSGQMAVKQLKKGEAGWVYMKVVVSSSGSNWYFYRAYREKYNDNGTLTWGYNREDAFTLSKDRIIYQINLTLQDHVPSFLDPEGRAIFTTWLNAAYNNVVAGANYSATYSRDVVPALDAGASSVNASTLGYRVNVDPATISEEGVNYLNDPDAFYQWFVTNYMNGTNQGTFVTPLDDAYDEIRTQLETIINQLNTLASTGGVSEQTLNQLKTDILNAINSVNSKVSGLESTLNSIEGDITSVKTGMDTLGSTLTSVSNSLNGLQTDVTGVKTSIDTLSTGLDATLTGVSNSLNGLQTDVTGVKTSIDTLTTDINEAQEQQQTFWDGLMQWLNETLFQKLQELLETLFLPTQEQLDELLDIELPEYEKSFSVDVSLTSQSASIPISLYGATVDLSRYISDYADTLKDFMNIFVSALAAVFVIRAFRVYLHID